jgi:hypothetical protein
MFESGTGVYVCVCVCVFVYINVDVHVQERETQMCSAFICSTYSKCESWKNITKKYVAVAVLCTRIMCRIMEKVQTCSVLQGKEL